MQKNLLKKLFALSLTFVAITVSLSAMEGADPAAAVEAAAAGAAQAGAVVQRRGAGADAQERETCSICLQEVAKALLIQTGCPRTTAETSVHEFCKECLTKWVKRSNDIRCPICRQPLSAALLRKIDTRSLWQRVHQNQLFLALVSLYPALLFCTLLRGVNNVLVTQFAFEPKNAGGIAVATAWLSLVFSFFHLRFLYGDQL